MPLAIYKLLSCSRMREIMNSHPRVNWALGTLAYDENNSVVKLLQMKGLTFAMQIHSKPHNSN